MRRRRLPLWPPRSSLLAVLMRPALALRAAPAVNSDDGTAAQVPEVRSTVANWVTSAFGQCTKTACGTAVKRRAVECREAIKGISLPDAACATIPPPAAYDECSCDLEVCKAGDPYACVEFEEHPPAAGPVAPSTHFAKIGCFKLHPGDHNPGLFPWSPMGLDDVRAAAPMRATSGPSGRANAPLPPPVHPFDNLCVNWRALSKCRSGLPFFRNTTARTPNSCYEFCVRRGLDVFALVSHENNTECRCGATKINEAIWHYMPPRPAVLFDTAALNLSIASGGKCPLLVYHYTGFFELGGVPRHLTRSFVQDTAYIDSIALAHSMPLEVMDDGHNTRLPTSIQDVMSLTDPQDATNKQAWDARRSDKAMGHGRNAKTPMSIHRDMSANEPQVVRHRQAMRDGSNRKTPMSIRESLFPNGSQVTRHGRHTKTPISIYEGVLLNESQGAAQRQAGPAWARPCYPSNCASGRGPWTRRTPLAPKGVPKTWQEYTIVPYWFAPGLDDVRKDTFRTAVAAWLSDTCVVLEESKAKPADNAFIEVTNVDSSSCFVSGVGVGHTTLSLGWCKDPRHLGNVIHEIGHALGMTHEQQRWDATHHYYGKGPHLVIYWDSIASGWQGQYKPKKNAYLGSAFDGVGDPVAGYMPYDFGSIMHYAAGHHFDTVPGHYREQAGQRSALSHSDIVIVRDMYQCHLLEGATPPPAPPPSEFVSVSGACPEASFIDGTYASMGHLPNGAMWYRKHDMNLYFDPSCNGGGMKKERWIFDDDTPATDVDMDMDNDGNCIFWGRVNWQDGPDSLPWGKHEWHLFCGSVFAKVQLTIAKHEEEDFVESTTIKHTIYERLPSNDGTPPSE